MADTSYDPKNTKTSEYEQFYKEAMDNTSQYNARLMLERRFRLPYLDSQTGLAQSNCFIWFQKRYRSPGLKSGQLYTYPSKRWKKSRPTPPQHVMESKPVLDMVDEIEASTQLLIKGFTEGNVLDEAGLSMDTSEDVAFLNSLGPQDVFPDAGEIDNVESESDEDFVLPSKRKAKPKPKTPKRRKPQDPDQPTTLSDEKDKPFVCKSCGKRYRYRAGLNYHVSHTHQEEEEEEDDPEVSNSPLPQPSMNTPAKKVNGIAEASNYCDFCLGDSKKNVKTGEAEVLVSCSDCGRSGHPTCLQFTDRMISNVSNYRWQCIECKSCTLCGTSDNDDQLLFCDDCDRGYHMYCLTPAMSAPPEGNWSCDLCIHQDVVVAPSDEPT